MGYPTISGDVSTPTISKASGSYYSKTVTMQEIDLEGYALANSRNGQMSITRRPAGRQIPPNSRPASNTSKSSRIALLLNKAKRLAFEMESYARSGELIDLSNCGFSLTSTLEDLWALRDSRESDWKDLLNLLQGALAKEEFERYSLQQCIAVQKVITEHLADGYIEIDDLERSVRLLRDAGLDPWKGISGMVSQ